MYEEWVEVYGVCIGFGNCFGGSECYVVGIVFDEGSKGVVCIEW